MSNNFREISSQEDLLVCRRCGSVVTDSSSDSHIEWHDNLLYWANTITNNTGNTLDLLKYSSKL